MKGTVVHLGRTWTVGDRLGGGGFGQVYLVESAGEVAAAKFVPKVPGAERELLLVNLDDAVNVVPVIDSGEHENFYVLVMPKADGSLRDHMTTRGPSLAADEVVTIAADIAAGLASLDGQVVHRDLKPENVLRLDNRWCLADFGISRYADASTAPDTRKFSLSYPYGAPERWRLERATIAADVYALGVMIFEMLAGHLPFTGPTEHDFREQHLHQDPPALVGGTTGLITLADECLYKAPDARPSPANLHARLAKQQSAPPLTGGLAALQDANLQEVRQRAVEEMHRSVALTQAERQASLARAARTSLGRICSALGNALAEAAPAARKPADVRNSWTLQLGQATLTFSGMTEGPFSWGSSPLPAMDVVATAAISLSIARDHTGYEGRSHSLWFVDATKAGDYGWFETAFMFHPALKQRASSAPFDMSPGEQAARAIGPGLGDRQVAWPFTRLEADDLGDFINRWGGWFASAANGRLGYPSTMPERDPDGSWRSH